MKANKYTFKIEVNVLSRDTIQGLLLEVAENLNHENKNGYLIKDDGDFISWETKSEKVEF